MFLAFLFQIISFVKCYEYNLWSIKAKQVEINFPVKYEGILFQNWTWKEPSHSPDLPLFPGDTGAVRHKKPDTDKERHCCSCMDIQKSDMRKKNLHRKGCQAGTGFPGKFRISGGI